MLSVEVHHIRAVPFLAALNQQIDDLFGFFIGFVLHVENVAQQRVGAFRIFQLAEYTAPLSRKIAWYSVLNVTGGAVSALPLRSSRLQPESAAKDTHSSKVRKDICMD